jgi:hypothetical protein
MTSRAMEPSPERIQDALETLRDLIAARYPDAVFSVFEHDDPPGTYLRAVVDVEDTDEVRDSYQERLMDMQVEEGLPVYVAIRPPRWRIEAMHEEHLRRRAERERANAEVA